MHDLESVKTTVKNHPTETVAAVAAITILGLLFFNHNKTKKLKSQKIEYCTCWGPGVPFWKQFLLLFTPISPPKHLPHG